MTVVVSGTPVVLKAGLQPDDEPDSATAAPLVSEMSDAAGYFLVPMVTR
ncbi:MAG: hypothetical protein Q8Q58_14440 [Candidatus Rokubacteria bacterium]|nr:hypothetical protein [Candidatus Rokubacteria bacterium]